MKKLLNLFSLKMACVIAAGLSFTIGTSNAQCPTITAPDVYVCGSSGEAWVVATSSITSGLQWEWAVDNTTVVINTSPNTSHNNVDFAFTYGTGTSTVHITNLPNTDYALSVRAKRSGCSNPNWKDVYAFRASNPTVSPGSNQSICANASAISLSGATPSGGTWSGPGVSGGNTFTPSTALIGNQQIFYTYTDPTTQCQGVAARTVTVKEIPVLATQDVCKTFRAYILDPGVAGASGTWSGSNVNNGIFNPSNGTLGNNTVTYSYLMSNGCSGSTNMTINVYDHAPISAPNITSPTISNCGPAISTFSVPNPGGAYSSFLWYDDGVLITSTPGVAHSSSSFTTPTLSSTKQYTVQGVVDGDGDCATEPASLTALINQVPSAPSVNNGSNCANGLGTVSISGPNTSLYSYSWHTTSGVSITNASSIGGVDYALSSSNTVVAVSNITGASDHTIRVKATDRQHGCQSSLSDAVITYRNLPSVSIGEGIPAVACTNLVPFVPTAGSPLGGSWFLQNSSTNPPTNTAFTSFDPYAFGVGEKDIIYSYTDPYGCTNAASKTVTIHSITPPITQSFVVPHNTQPTITPSIPGPGYTYNWYSNPGDGIAIATGNSWTTDTAIDSTAIYYVAIKPDNIPSCESLVRAAIILRPNRSPFVYAGSDKSIVTPGVVRLNGVTQDADGEILSSIWSKISGPGYQMPSILTTPKLVLGGLTPGTFVFRLTATDNNLYTSFDEVSITVIQGPPNNRNYVFSEAVQIDSVFDEGSVEILTAFEKIKAGQYIDGIGRNSQGIQWRLSPNGKDIVQRVLYDRFGRDSVQFLPYPSSEGDGLYKLDTVSGEAYFNSEQYQFYQGADKVAWDTMPYAKSVLENSPLNRVKVIGSPGAAWQPETGHVIVKEYLTNLSDTSVLKFNYEAGDGVVSLTPGSYYYPKGKLSCTRTSDEQQNDVFEFVDNQGRVVCKKVKVSNNIYASTYYVYDDYGTLAVVIPPEGVKAILDYLK
jgi:Domain of unknown function (DUF6443)/Ig-like domain CHU_C associated